MTAHAVRRSSIAVHQRRRRAGENAGVNETPIAFPNKSVLPRFPFS